jgi:hypothetical protein
MSGVDSAVSFVVSVRMLQSGSVRFASVEGFMAIYGFCLGFRRVNSVGSKVWSKAYKCIALLLEILVDAVCEKFIEIVLVCSA